MYTIELLFTKHIKVAFNRHTIITLCEYTLYNIQHSLLLGFFVLQMSNLSQIHTLQIACSNWGLTKLPSHQLALCQQAYESFHFLWHLDVSKSNHFIFCDKCNPFCHQQTGNKEPLLPGQVVISFWDEAMFYDNSMETYIIRSVSDKHENSPWGPLPSSVSAFHNFHKFLPILSNFIHFYQLLYF